MTHYSLEALDTLFFRDGRPFTMGETGQMEVTALFPPYPPTVVGALRLALAKAQGWQQRGIRDSWTDGAKGELFKKVLGNGQSLGDVSFTGPYILYNEKPVFPAPAILLGVPNKLESTVTWSDMTRLRPTSETYTSDIGTQQFVEAINHKDELKLLEGSWLTLEGMQAVLDGGKPCDKDIIDQGKLWKSEDRIGIQRDKTSHTTKDDALYQTSHIRLQSGTKLGATINNVPEDWQQLDGAVALGGEQRMVWIDKADKWQLPTCNLSTDEHLRYSLTLITPGDFFTPQDNKQSHFSSIENIVTSLGSEGSSANLISACTGKAVFVGGWDSRKNEPLPLRPLLPAGSTWFLETTIDNLAMVKELHGSHIGKNCNWGFGQVLVGTWNY